MAEAHPRNSKGGWHCVGKEAFDSGRDAVRAAKNIERLRKGGIDSYRCPSCGKFHIGRGAPKHKLRRIRNAE